MQPDLRDSAKRVQDFLQARGFSCEVVEFGSSTRTAQDAADSIGCTVAQIAKSLVFRDIDSGRAVLVIASGVNRVDVGKIRLATGLVLGKADGDFVKKKVGFAIGGIPPAGHVEPLLTLLDVDLRRHETIWAAAGTPFAVFRLCPADLESLTGGQWLDMSVAPGP
jgi:prolyl-tRNA editing enzyme YbaK/EbsC (Cys-tRNA(Pro) deacylase)